MKVPTFSSHTRRAMVVACAVIGAVAVTVSAASGASADDRVPPVPPNIEVEAGNVLFLIGHAFGTQNYICLPSGAGFAYSLFTPQATLFTHRAKQVTTHFFSPNPDENGTIRATWQHSRDTSRVWAQLVPDGSSTDPNFVEAGAVAWLKLQTAGVEEGPGGGDTLTATTFVQRLNTHGGVAPSTGCAGPADVGRRQFVPYEADYFFYRKAGGREGRDD